MCVFKFQKLVTNPLLLPRLATWNLSCTCSYNDLLSLWWLTFLSHNLTLAISMLIFWLHEILWFFEKKTSRKPLSSIATHTLPEQLETYYRAVIFGAIRCKSFKGWQCPKNIAANLESLFILINSRLTFSSHYYKSILLIE